MDTAAVTVEREKGRKSELIVLAAGLLLMLLSLSRYVVNGEPVDVRSDTEAIPNTIVLYDGVEVCQPLVITEEMDWRQGYYALYVARCEAAGEGRLLYTVAQGELQQTGAITLHGLESGEWIQLAEAKLGRLTCGEAMLRLRTEDVAQGELALAAGPDYYGFGAVDYDGALEDVTLAQAYHYHRTGTEYQLRLLCYGIVLLGAIALFTLVSRRYAEDRRTCLIAFGILTVMFMAMIYVLDSSIYLEPTYAEAVTNFLRYARKESFIDNLLIADAGYLPLWQRLLTLFFVKVLRLPAAYAPYCMQAAACLVCSMIWSFFTLAPFQRLMRLLGRIVWCVLVMLTCFCEETLFFTNHAYWGIYLLLLMLVAELEAFSRLFYVCLLGFCALLCLSKGTYAVMLPFMALYLLLFHRSMGRREKLFTCVVGMAALIQVLYAFSGRGDGGSWISASADGAVAGLLRLIGRALIEFTAYGLLPAGKYLTFLSGLLPVLALAVLVCLAAGFFKMILLKIVHEKMINRQIKDFYAIVMFQLMVIAFFLLTVKPVPESWRALSEVTFGQMGHKYEIFSDIGFYMLLLTGSALVVRRWEAAKQTGTVRHAVLGKILEACRSYGILVLTGIFCVTNPVLHLTGWQEAKVSDRRVYAEAVNTGWWDCRELLQNSAFFIPVRGGIPDNHWGYCRNASLYQVGTEFYFEETTCVNLEETLSGYHSAYEIQDPEQAHNLIGIMIERPTRIASTDCRVQILDADHTVIAETAQTGAGRYQKMLFYFQEPVQGAAAIRFVDHDGNPVHYKDYIAWISAW